MAEVVGVVSAGVGMVAFAHQVACHITTLRANRRFNKARGGRELRSLVKDLDDLRDVASLLSPYRDMVNTIFPSCEESLREIDVLVREISARLEENQQNGWDRVRSSFSGELKEAIENAQKKIRHVMSKLMLYSSLVTLAQTRSCGLLDATRMLEPPTSPEDSRRVADLTLETTLDSLPPRSNAGISPVGEDLSSSSSVVRPQQSQVAPRIKLPSCGLRLCRCSCHRTRRRYGSFWNLEYSPLSALLGACDNPICSSKRTLLTARVSLFNLGIPWVITGTLDIISFAGGYVIRPPLRLQKVVDNQSVPFQIVLRTCFGSMSHQEAKAQLLAHTRRDPTVLHQINTEGKDCVALAISFGSTSKSPKEMMSLVKTLVELGNPVVDRGNELMDAWIMWSRSRLRLEFLQQMLDCGFDPDTMNTNSRSWDYLIDMSGLQHRGNPQSDPFLVGCLGTLSQGRPECLELHPLHYAALAGDVSRARNILCCLGQGSLDGQRAFHGQTPLHLAVDHIDIVRALVDAGHGVDLVDKTGATALIYAAARGCADTAMFLITRGADICVNSTSEFGTCIDACFSGGNVDLGIRILEAARARYPKDVVDGLVSQAITVLARITKYFPNDSVWGDGFDYLVRQCEGVNFTFDDMHRKTEDNTLMHFVHDARSARTLIECGFSNLNRANSRGEYPLHFLVESGDPELIRVCLENEADVNHRDNDHHPALAKLIRALCRGRQSARKIIECIRLFLEYGADVFAPDECICACAPDGCLVTTAFQPRREEQRYSIWSSYVIWTLEWICLVKEYRGLEACKKTIQSFVRKAVVEELGITHVCCYIDRDESTLTTRSEDSSGQRYTAKGDAEEIIDEESDFIDKLEQEMADPSLEDLTLLKLRWATDIGKIYNSWPVIGQDHPHRLFIEDHRYEFESQVARYALYLEHKLAVGRRYGTDDESWYLERVDFIAQVLMAASLHPVEIEISIDISTEKPYRKACAHHFRQTMLSKFGAYGKELDDDSDVSSDPSDCEDYESETSSELE